jgi:hypothetical protein
LGVYVTVAVGKFVPAVTALPAESRNVPLVGNVATRNVNVWTSSGSPSSAVSVMARATLG